MKIILGFIATVTLLSNRSFGDLVALDTPYSSTLSSSDGSITVNYEVIDYATENTPYPPIGPGQYLYEYQVVNSSSDINLTLDSMEVLFGINPNNVLSAGGGVTSTIGPGTVQWGFGAIGQGNPGPNIGPDAYLQTGLLWFASANLPTLGTADVAGVSQGSDFTFTGQVAVPVPEPTTIVAGAMLLIPFGMSALRILRKSHTA